jgi:ribokinase
LAEVIGVGALNWDRLYRVDRFAAPGEEIVIREIKEEAGGSAANTIAALGRLGVDCGFVGKIGNDKESIDIINAFRGDGVDTAGIIKVDGITGTVLAFVDDAGERTMYVDPSVNDTLHINDIDRDYISSAKFLHISSFAGETSVETIKKLPDVKGNASLSFAPGFLCWRGLDFLMPLLKGCHILFLNEKEATALTGVSSEKVGESLLDVGVEKIVVTRGERGSLVTDKKGLHSFSGIKTAVVDTTGAGDAFAAGFLFGTIRDLELSICAKIGNFVASNCIQHVGARNGLPARKDVDAFLEKLL